MNTKNKLSFTYTTPNRTVTLPIPQATARRVSIAPKPKVRPSEHPDPKVRHRVGGLIGLLSAGAMMLDHAARNLHEYGLFRHEAKQALGQLTERSDKLVKAMQEQFDFEDSDATNGLSDALGLAYEKFCQLTPAQMDALLQHADGMINLNVAYVPALTPTDTLLK